MAGSSRPPGEEGGGDGADGPRADVVAGRPSAVWLHAPEPIPPDTALTLWLRGPKTYRGIVAERESQTVNIEARFAVRVAGNYTLHVEDASKHTLLKDRLKVVAGPVHVPSCSLDAEKASADGRQQLLRAVDAFGNKHVSGGVRLLATVGPTHKCSITDNGDGTYSVQLPPNAPNGPCQLRVWQPALAAEEEESSNTSSSSSSSSHRHGGGGGGSLGGRGGGGAGGAGGRGG